MIQNKNKYILCFTMLLFLLIASPMFAQTIPPPVGRELPIDGGILTLLFAGLFYGVKKSIKKK